MKKTKRKFTSDFKLKVILDTLTERDTLTVLSQRYNLHPNQISIWKQDFLEKAKQTLESKKERPLKDGQDTDALFAKIGQLQMELDFLKKVVMIPEKERFAMVEKSQRLSLRRQCELLCIPRTNFYYKPKPESRMNLYLMKLMDEQYLKAPFYGFPRMFEYVQNACPMWILNQKRVWRLYKKMGLRSLLPGPHTSKPNPKATFKFPYLLKDLKIEKVNQVWASDITYIPMRAGYMFLYAIIDTYSRFITGLGLSNNMTAEWCATITREALYKWGKPQIFNTDQGAQFTSDCFVNLLQEHQIQISMDERESHR